MYIELLIIAFIIIYIFIVNGKINKNEMFSKDSKLHSLIKEKDYDFLLISKYGEKVYDANEVYMTRIRNGVITTCAILFVFITNLTYLKFIGALVAGYLVYKKQYLDLKKWYKANLNYIDSLLPYYLKTLEVLIHHYTVPVALAKSMEDAPEVFKPGLRRLVEKIESGDSSINPYVDFAKEYPVRDSMRMMRLLYRLGLGEQEKKHQQLVSFSKSVSSLQANARAIKYKNRLSRMEKRTMTMLLVTGCCSLGLLLISMIFLIKI